jgi:hypothetical protein|tara:strand:+ start:6145 stop:6438 length:294 start_codon:yes stop_codon:yes gene_type:complete
MAENEKIVYWSNRLKYILDHLDKTLKEWRTSSLRMRDWSPLMGENHTNNLITEEANLTGGLMELVEMKNECMTELAALKTLKTKTKSRESETEEERK